MPRPRKNAPKPNTQELSLVPVEDQPYPLPEGWKWVRLGDVAEVIMGQSPSGSDTTDDDSYTPLIGGASDMGHLYPKATKYTKRPTKLSNETDIIVCIRATLGRPIFSTGEYCLGRGVAAIRSEKIFCRFTRFLFINFEQYLYDNATGTTFAQVNSDTLKKMPIPLPPLDEQERIVTRIESLFAKLDEAKEKAEAVLDSFETRKAAILHKAFTGELTAKWREEKGIGKESWKETILMHVCEYLKAGGDKPEDFVEEKDNIRKIPVVANGISNDGIIGYTAHTKYDGHTVTISGRGAIGFSIFRDYAYYPVVRLIVIKPKQCLDAKFLKYTFEAFPEKGTGSSIPQLTVPMIKDKPIFYPSLPEQQEITRILDSLLEKEQQSKEAAETVLEQIDLMKKAILAKAFRGELGN